MSKKEDKQELLEDCIVHIPKHVLDMLLGSTHFRGDLIALFTFYLYTAKWQKSYRIKSTTGYVQKGLGWGKDKVIARKRSLVDLGLIEDYIDKDEKGEIKGHYIKLKYFILSPPSDKTIGSKTPRVVKSDTNAYIYNNINAYKLIDNSTPPKEGDEEPSEEKPVQEEINHPCLAIDPILVKGTTPTARLYRFYTSLLVKKYGGVTGVNYGRDMGLLKKLYNQLAKEGDNAEYKMAFILGIYMDWKGVKGDDNFTVDLLANNCHNLMYLPKLINPIVAFTRNVLRIDLDNQKEINKIINRKLIELKLHENCNTAV